MKNISTVCVYCGSGSGTNPAYMAAARELGSTMAREGVALVYGGGGYGLMGAVAEAVVTGGGRVTGVIPEFLQAREGHLKLAHEEIVVENMHQRKWAMYEQADAFVALPGGIGTLEELVEIMSWAQLGRHGKPILMANIEGFFNPVLELFDHMRREGFIRAPYPVHYLVADNVPDILPMLFAASGRQPHGEGLPIEKLA